MRGTYVDTIGSLHDYLGELLREHPQLQRCLVFAFDGDNFSTDHFLWTSEDGTEVEIEEASGVTLYTRDMPYESAPDEAALFSREEAIAEAEARIDRVLMEVARNCSRMRSAVQSGYDEGGGI